MFQLAVAVADPFDLHAELVSTRQIQVRQRRARRIPQVPAALELSGATAQQDDRQTVDVVHVAVAHPAAVEERQVIEQRAVAVRRRLQLFQVVGEQSRVKALQLGELVEVLRVGSDGATASGAVRARRSPDRCGC